MEDAIKKVINELTMIDPHNDTRMEVLEMIEEQIRALRELLKLNG